MPQIARPSESRVSLLLERQLLSAYGDQIVAPRAALAERAFGPVEEMFEVAHGFRHDVDPIVGVVTSGSAG